MPVFYIPEGDAEGATAGNRAGDQERAATETAEEEERGDSLCQTSPADRQRRCHTASHTCVSYNYRVYPSVILKIMMTYH